MNANTLTTANATTLATATLNDYYNEFLQYIDTSKATANTYKKALLNFVTYLNANNIATPTRGDVLDYKNALLERSYKPNTVNLYLTAVKRFYEWLNTEHGATNIASGIKRAHVDKNFKKDYLTTAECKAVLTQFNTNTLQGARNYAILLTMLTCGLRCCEITHLTQSSVAKSGDAYKLYIQGKGHDDADAFVIAPQCVVNAINNYNGMRPTNELTPSAPLFASTSNNNKGGAMTVCAISTMVKNSFKNVGLNSDRLTAHSTRHTAITLALIGGATVQQAQQLARHTNINTTLIYAHNLEQSANPCTSIVADMIV